MCVSVIKRMKSTIDYKETQTGHVPYPPPIVYSQIKEKRKQY